MPKNVSVILFEPSMPENIGTTARAMANMGLGRLILVSPYRLDMKIMLAAATRGGQRHVEEMTVVDSLPEALAGMQFAAATTARRGRHRGPFLSPADLAGRLGELPPDTQAAIVFGPERTGLGTAELRHCQAVIRIPTADPGSSSLNLAQAVLLIGYELLMAEKQPARAKGVTPAPLAEVEGMYDHLSHTLSRIGFLPESNQEHWMMSFKRIFNRSGLTHGDCNLIRGLCRQIGWCLEHPEERKRRYEPDEGAGK